MIGFIFRLKVMGYFESDIVYNRNNVWITLNGLLENAYLNRLNHPCICHHHYVNIKFLHWPECLQMLCIDDIWDLCGEKTGRAVSLHSQLKQRTIQTYWRSLSQIKAFIICYWGAEVLDYHAPMAYQSYCTPRIGYPWPSSTISIDC